MNQKALSMMVFTLFGLFSAFVYSYYFPITLLFGIESQIPISILTILNFFFGVIFFGYLSFIPAILIGLQLGAEKNVVVFFYIIPLVISTYAGSKLGFMLEADFWGKKNYLKAMKSIVTILIVALIIALVIEAIIPYIIQLWPSDTGFVVKESKTVMELLSELSKLRR